METGSIPSNDVEDEPLEHLLDRLLSDHKSLDEKIEEAAGQGALAALDIQRMKKKKLALKDQIVKVKALLVPDIIA